MTQAAVSPALAATELVGTSCVIVAFHRPESLARLLVALRHPALSVVVVNMECDPAVASLAQREGARVLDVNGNPGFGVGVNRGVAHADRDVVVLINDDAQIDAEAVLRLAGIVERGEAEVAVPRVVNDRGEVELTIAALPTPASLAREWAILPDRPIARVSRHLRVQKWREPVGPERIEAASAVVLAVKTQLLRDFPMPEDYFLYWEESEWFWRLRERDTVVHYRPEVVCVHAGGRADVRAAKSRLLARNAVRCVRRTQGRAAALGAFGVVVGWNLRLVLVDALRAFARWSPGARSRFAARRAGLTAALMSWREVR
jgi:GT2 family glycosyltransferase